MERVVGGGGLLGGEGCWVGRVVGWRGLLGGQGCWVGRVVGWGGLLGGEREGGGGMRRIRGGSDLDSGWFAW